MLGAVLIMIPDQKRIAECYQPLFDHLHNEYGLTLLVSEMDEIVNLVEKVNDNLNEAWRVICDVHGCNETAANQGGCWQEAGYLCVCSKHSQMWRDKKPMPKLKQIAVDREKSRKPDGTLP